MTYNIGQGNPCSPADMGQGVLNLVKDFWHGGHVKGQWSMLRLLIVIKPHVDNFFLLPKWEEVFCLHLTEVLGQFPIPEEWPVGSNLEFHPVDYQLQSGDSNISD